MYDRAKKRKEKEEEEEVCDKEATRGQYRTARAVERLGVCRCPGLVSASLRIGKAIHNCRPFEAEDCSAIELFYYYSLYVFIYTA